MIRKIQYIFILLFISNLLLSQSVKLEWKDGERLYMGTDSVDVLAFDQAEYIDGTFLPYYVYSQALTAEEANRFDFNVSISGISFSEISSTNVNVDALEQDFKIVANVSASRRTYSLDVVILPLKNENETISRLDEFTLVIDKSPKVQTRSTSTLDPFVDNSVLAQGDWTKVAVKKNGIYKITYSELKSMGVKPEKVSIFTAKAGTLETMITNYSSDLQEIPIYDGGSYILFYGESHNTWSYNSRTGLFEHTAHPFWNENYYFITSDAGEKKRITSATATTGTPTVNYTTFNDYDALEPQIESIGHSGAQWYSAAIYVGQSYSHSFSFSNIVSETATMTVKTASRTVGSNIYNSTKIYVDGNQKGSYSLATTSGSSTSKFAYETTKSYTFIPQGNTISTSMSYTSSQASAKAWFDFFVVNVKRHLKIPSNSLLFRTTPTTDDVVSYTISNAKSSTQIWDVTDVNNVTSLSSSLSNSTLTFQSTGTELRQYAAVNTDGKHSSPTVIGKVTNQNLHGIDVPDMVIVTDSKFMTAVDKLADIRRDEGLDVYITTQDKIFNEFSGGKADITAIRWFMKSLYDRSADDDKLKYLLLFGDADVNNRLYEDGSSVVMSYQSRESLSGSSTYVSDDYFGLLDDDEGNGSHIDLYDKVDIGIGRIPVNTLSEAEAVVNKIDKYMHDSKANAWKNSVCLVADDQDSGKHVISADLFAKQIAKDHPSMAIKKIYTDAFQQKILANGNRYPDAKALVDKYIEEGVLVWGYSGHGSPTQLAEEEMMHINHINNYENMANLPVWMTATCDFCPYDHNKEVSAGERVLLNPNGGGVALFTTTRVVYINQNETMSLSFYKYIFNSDENGERLRLGDVARLSKSSIGTGINKRKFVLIGDPSLQLNFADSRLDVKTETINGQDITSFTDTLTSLSHVTITGYISRSDSSIDTDFNGIIFPSIYDKINNFSTLVNDPDSKKVNFQMWNSILYRGQAEVVDGRFSFTFLLPKDLDYSIGTGRIEYYAISDDIEANGHYEDFYIGGFNHDFEEDNEGPEVDLYMNTMSFRNGDVVNANPLMIAKVSDQSGINTSGTSIGHDICVKLNNDPSTIKILNSSYVTDAGDFTKGTVSYFLRDLPEGTHTLTFKVWDMLNNSTTKEISFMVKENTLPEISKVYCIPNPVELSKGQVVRFVAEHDRPERYLGVNLNIFDGRGALVYHSTEYSTTATNEIFFDWTPTSNLHGGLYYYRIIITDRDKVSSGKSNKILLVD